ncbi:hypothetical protein ACFLWA_09790 [Chloroflexota bacterium]
MRQFAARTHNLLSWFVFVGANLAIILIAMTVLGAVSSEVHAWGDRALMLLALLLLVAALISRTSRLTVGFSIGVFLLLMPVQGLLAYTQFLFPMINALHAVSGLSILWMSYSLAHGRARATVPEEQTALSSEAGAGTPSGVAAD